MAGYIMALDAGTTSNRCILFNEKGEMCSVAQKEFTQYFPKPGWVEHDADEIWSTQLGVAVEAMSKIGASAAGHCGHRHYQSARDRHRMGQEYRGTGVPRHCLAVPQDVGILRLSERPGASPSTFREKTGLDHRRLFFRHEDQMDPGSCRGRQRTGRTRGTSLWNGGDMADLEADQGPRPCDGLFQCLPHACCLISTH